MALCHTLKISSIYCFSDRDRGAFAIFNCFVNGIALSGGWVPQYTHRTCVGKVPTSVEIFFTEKKRELKGVGVCLVLVGVHQM